MSMSAQAAPTKLKPDFSHRLSVLGDEETSERLCDAVNSAADRAKSILHLLSGYFSDDRGKWNDEIMHNAIDAAIHEIKDIKSIVNAYHEADKHTCSISTALTIKAGIFRGIGFFCVEVRRSVMI
jgi:hypothetical protein